MTDRDQLLGQAEIIILEVEKLGFETCSPGEISKLIRDLAQAVRELEAEENRLRGLADDLKMEGNDQYLRAERAEERCQRLETALREILERGCAGGVLERIEHPSCGRDDCPTCIARAALEDTA